MFGAVKTTVYPDGLRRLFNPGGAGDTLMVRLAHSVRDWALSTSPVRTGRLADSHRVTRWGRGGYRVDARTTYALYVIKGTKPHKIYPRNKKALRWVSRGEVRFAAWVQHPGTRANPYLQEALVSGLRSKLGNVVVNKTW